MLKILRRDFFNKVEVALEEYTNRLHFVQKPSKNKKRVAPLKCKSKPRKKKVIPKKRCLRLYCSEEKSSQMASLVLEFNGWMAMKNKSF